MLALFPRDVNKKIELNKNQVCVITILYRKFKVNNVGQIYTFFF